MQIATRASVSAKPGDADTCRGHLPSPEMRFNRCLDAASIVETTEAQNGNYSLREIEEAKPRQAEMLEKPLLGILAFELRHLLGSHLATIRRERPVHFTPNR